MKYTVDANKVLVFPVGTPQNVTEGKRYEWKFNYDLQEGNEVSALAFIKLTGDLEHRSVRRLLILKKNESSGLIRFTAPLETHTAQCHFAINQVHPDDRADTVLLIDPTVDFKETTTEGEVYDDNFDYVKKYSLVNLEEEPWRAIGGKHNHVGKVKNFEQRLNWLQNKFDLSPDTTILDVGCGTGGLAHMLREFTNTPDNYVGMDLVQDAIDYCLKHYPEFSFYKSEMTSVPDIGKTFDLICLFNVIIHMFPEDTVVLLKNLRQYIKPDGHFLITVTINNDIKEHIGDRGGIEMSEDYFKTLMMEAGFTHIEKTHPNKTRGQMPFKVW